MRSLVPRSAEACEEQQDVKLFAIARLLLEVPVCENCHRDARDENQPM